MQCVKSAALLKGRQFQTSQHFQRLISVSSSIHSKHVNKLVNRFFLNNDSSKKKRKWHDHSETLNPAKFVLPQMKGEKNSHRLHVLNKVFMDKICDILSTGSISSLFTGYGLEISKVRVAQGMSVVNVHWYCTGSEIDDEIEKLLMANARTLREELSQQRVIGHIPPIQFVRDKRYYKFLEVEKRLAIAEYGEDFEPTHPSHYLIATDILQMELNPKIKEALEVSEEKTSNIFERALKLSAAFDEPQEPIELPKDLPTMRHDVLGVDTQKINTWVRKGISRGKAEHRKSSLESPPSLDTSPSETNSHPQSIVTRTEDIRKWASTYEQRLKKQKRKREREVLSVPRHYVEESYDEIIYEEEEDYMDEEEYDLDSQLE